MRMPPPIAEKIKALEESLLKPEVRVSRNLISDLLDSDFYEIGASGRSFDREAIIGSLASESQQESKRTITDFVLVNLSENLVQARYRIPETRTLRSSLWRKHGNNWKIIFHQGTKEFLPE